MPLIPLFLGASAPATNKSRASAFNFCNPFDYVLPVADGTIDALDRRWLWGLSTDIATDAPVPPTPVPSGRSRTTGFTNRNRSSISANNNRSYSFSDRNRTIKQ